MAAAPTSTGGVNTQQLRVIGRPNGPDVQLKINSDLLAFQPTGGITGDIIKDDSSITEVLNVISFLISTDRDPTNMVEGTASVPGAGEIDAASGYYGNDTLTAISVTTLLGANFCSLDLALPANPGAGCRFPVSILKRRADPAAAPGSVPNFQDMTSKRLTADADGATAVRGLLSDCIKQMIQILIKTRTILGPTGWTDLFQKISGGSSANKKAKRTHRHRRRYSSKQY
jgi:hypothetical protein